MQPDSRHAKALGPRLRIFALRQTTAARLLLNHPRALSPTDRWRDPARQRRRIAGIPFSSSLHVLLSEICSYAAPSPPLRKSSSRIVVLVEGVYSDLTPQSYITRIFPSPTLEL